MEINKSIQNAMNDYQKITGLRSYMVLNKEDLNSPSEKNYFCKCLKISTKAVKLCEECAAEAIDIILKTKKEYIYSCHAGIIKVAIPVVVNGEIVSIVIVEGILNSKQLESSDQWAQYLSNEYDVSASIMKKTFETVTVMNERELNASIKLLHDLIDYHISKEVWVNGQPAQF